MTTAPTPPGDDYAAALIPARRAKSCMVIILLLILVGEVTLFFLYHEHPQWQPRGQDLLRYLTGLFEFGGVVLSLTLMIDLFLIVHILLAARLAGTAQVVKATLWSAILALLLFPWQAFLENAAFTSTDFKIPGVLFTWDELLARGRWNLSSLNFWEELLRWSRFVIFPSLAAMVVLVIQIHTAWGLKRAFPKTAESPPPVS